MSDGIGGWSVEVFAPSGRIFLGGRVYTNWQEVQAGPFTDTNLTEPLTIATTHTGATIAYSFYRGESAPVAANRKGFSTAFLVDDQADFFHFVRLESLARPVQGFVGGWTCDTFPDAQSGHAYALRRSPALGVVPGLDSDDYPITVTLDGVVTPEAATIVGQTVLANASGELSITYAPLYWFYIQGVQKLASEALQIVVSCTLNEATGS